MAASREWFEKDYYKTLGVSAAASQKDITKAYRKLARLNHPDANPDDPTSADRFKEISVAYDVVGDETKRKEYDEVRRLGPVAGGFGGGGPGGFNINADDLGDLFGGLFGGGGRHRGPGNRSTVARGADLSAALHLSFEDSVNGVTTTVNLTSDARCSTCSGSGAKPGTSVSNCIACAGRGTVDDNQGPFSFTRPCAECRGSGTRVESPCATCRGTGVERRPRAVKVRIPAGVEDGKRLRLKGKGAPGQHGGPPGDLLIALDVARHETFGRRGNHLTTAVPITYPEAVLGGEVKVPTLDGAGVTLKVPPGTKSGRVMRVKGRGVPADVGAGDLLVTLEIAVPTNPSSEERRLLQSLAKLGTDGLRDDAA